MPIEDIIPLIIAIIIIIAILIKSTIGAPFIGKIIASIAKALIPVVAERVAHHGANIVVDGLKEHKLLPQNLTLPSLL